MTIYRLDSIPHSPTHTHTHTYMHTTNACWFQLSTLSSFPGIPLKSGCSHQ